jgi:predicted PurR-regulated permease PerM
MLGIIPPMIGTVSELFALISTSLATWEKALFELSASSAFFTDMLSRGIEMLKGTLTSILSADIPSLITGVLSSAVGETFNLLVGLIISIYLLAGRRMLSSIFGKTVAAILPSGGAHRVSMFIKRLYSNLTEFLASRILSALFLGVSSYLIFYLFGIPFFALLVLIIMVCNLFPVFGTIFSFLFCGLVLLVTKPVYTLPVLGILVLLEIIDNLVIEPHTMPHRDLRQNVGSALVLMLCGYAVGGLIGALCAIPVFATVRNALRAFSVHLLNRRRLPTMLEEYHDFDMRAHMAAREADVAASGADAPAKAENAADMPAEADAAVEADAADGGDEK